MTNEKHLRMTDMELIDDVFDMRGGYVLDFSNRTFAEFFRDELDVNIDDPRWEQEGTSKAKRLRCYLRNLQPAEAARTIRALWEYREIRRWRRGEEEMLPEAKQELFQLIERLGGIALEETRRGTAQPQESDTAAKLHHRLMELQPLTPQERGYAFERFLLNLFQENGLAPRASFRLKGEQIDGSFEVQGETYLLEAKWVAQPIGSRDLYAFNAQVENKARWSRGLFISESGFTDDGLEAFGTGNSVICMDGLDRSEMLHRRMVLSEVLRRKTRRAAETGRPFVRVRDLF